MYKKYGLENIFMGRLPQGSDLYKGLQSFLEEHNIKAGTVEGIGALRKACLGYYDQDSKKYCSIDIEEPMEVLSLLGNISLKEGKAFPHCHIILGDKNGSTRGGHLMEGCSVFAFEFVIKQFDGASLVRGFDKETRLSLWNFDI